LLADLLGNMQDVSVNVPGIQTASVTGGLRPSAMGAGGKQAMGELLKQALFAQMQNPGASGEMGAAGPGPAAGMPMGGAAMPGAAIPGGANDSGLFSGIKERLAKQQAEPSAAAVAAKGYDPWNFQGGEMLAAPQLQGLKQAGGLEKFLNIAGLIGSAAGGIGSVLKPEDTE
jgi:hypothetical protein